MSEQSNNSPQEGQKTVFAFIAGLLVGGLLVWVFAGDSAEHMADETDNSASIIDSTDSGSSNGTPASNDAGDSTSSQDNTSSVVSGPGSIVVDDQSAGSVVMLEDVTFPNDEGWIGVRDYDNGQLTGLLGVARWSLEQGLVPDEVELLRPTEAGGEYAVVFYSESGDREFSLAEDVQLDTTVAVFEAE